MAEDMQIHVGTIVTTLVSVKRGKEYRTYIVEYDTETNTVMKITYIGESKRVEVGARTLQEMNEIVKAMGLKFP
jgi:hypothetical protein